MTDLRLAVKTEYFNQIKSGEKKEEYRLDNPYWIKRLWGRKFDRVIITLGYPKSDDEEKILIFPWRGYHEKTITHPHFGPDPVDVFAIILEA